MRETNDTLPVWAQFAVCLGLSAAMALCFYYTGDSEDLVLLRTLVSVIWIVWAMGLGRGKAAPLTFGGAPFSEILIFWAIESLMLSAWLTIIVWQPGQPIQESLWTFGFQFAAFFVMMSLFSYFRRKRISG